MLIFNHWQSRTALLMALGITSTAVAPLISSTSAVATQPDVVGQLFPGSSSQSSRLRVPAGTTIPVRYSKGEKIIVTPDETTPVTLTVAENVRSNRGNILISAGSQIKGELQPASDGTQFVAEELVLRNSEEGLPISATSEVITETETISERSDPDLIRGAVLGAGAAAVLSDIFGDIDLGEVLAGAGIGVAAETILRGRKDVEVVVVNPDTDLDLTLQEDFVPRTSQ